MDRTFYALSDPTRRDLLRQIARRPDSNVSDLASRFDMSFNAVSKHLVVLEQARLVEREKCGREYRFRMVSTGLDEAQSWIEQVRSFWNKRLDALEAVLAAKRESISPKKSAKRK